MGKNVILNRTAGQKITMYFETINRAPVRFGPETAVDFRFPYAASGSVLMHFAEGPVVAGYLLDSVDVQSDATSDADGSVHVSGPTDDSSTSSKVITAAFQSTGSVPNENYDTITTDIAYHQGNSAASAKVLAGADGPQATALSVYRTDETGRSALLENIVTCLGSLGPATLANGSTGSLYGSQGLLFEYLSYQQTNYPGDDCNQQTLCCGLQFQSRPFSVAYWNSAYAALEAAAGVVGVAIPKSPSTITSDFATAPWSNPDFTAWVATNFTTLCNYIVHWWNTLPANTCGAGFSPALWGGNAELPNSLLLAPCPAVYDIFYSAYLLSNKVGQAASFLLDPNGTIDAAAWSTAFATAQSVFPPASSDLLTEEGAGVSYPFNTANPWYDSNFSSYAFKNFSSLISGLVSSSDTPMPTVPVSNPVLGVSYQGVVPCRALFDYVYAQYQLSLLQPLLEVTPREIDAYAAPISCVFNFSQVLTSGSDGTVMLGVTVRNLPGYWDTSFQVPLIKETSELNGVLQLGLASSEGHQGEGSRIEFLSAPPGVVSIEENWGLNLWGDPQHPVNIHADLFVNGNQLTASDAALKEAIEPLSEDLVQAFTELKPHTFRYKGRADHAKPTLGFIAQEVKESFPDFVEEHGGVMFVSYQQLGVLAIAALQRQERLIEELRRKLEALERRSVK
jgi:hypothetical protein